MQADVFLGGGGWKFSIFVVPRRRLLKDSYAIVGSGWVFFEKIIGGSGWVFFEKIIGGSGWVFFEKIIGGSGWVFLEKIIGGSGWGFLEKTIGGSGWVFLEQNQRWRLSRSAYTSTRTFNWKKNVFRLLQNSNISQSEMISCNKIQWIYQANVLFLGVRHFPRYLRDNTYAFSFSLLIMFWYMSHELLSFSFLTLHMRWIFPSLICSTLSGFFLLPYLYSSIWCT